MTDQLHLAVGTQIARLLVPDAVSGENWIMES